MNERNPYESDDTVDIPDFSSIKVNDDDIDRSVFKMNDDIPSYNEPEYDDEEDYYAGYDICERVVESEARRYLNCALLEEDDEQ